MTTAEFRSTPELVAKMRGLLENETLKLWIETYRHDATENPVKKAAPPDVTPHGAHIMLGEQTGWNMCLDRFSLGSVPLEPPPKQEEQTYANPPQDET